MVTFCPYTNRKSIRLTQANDMCYRSCCYFQQHHTYMKLFAIDRETRSLHTHLTIVAVGVTERARSLTYTERQMQREGNELK